MSDPEAAVEAFLDAVPEPARSALKKLRATIRGAAPGAEELINYGVPMFRLRGKNLVAYAAAKAHCSFLVMSTSTMEAFAAELEGYGTSKGTIRFTPDKPIPVSLVKRIVKARIAEDTASAKAPKG